MNRTDLREHAVTFHLHFTGKRKPEPKVRIGDFALGLVTVGTCLVAIGGTYAFLALR